MRVLLLLLRRLNNDETRSKDIPTIIYTRRRYTVDWMEGADWKEGFKLIWQSLQDTDEIMTDRATILKEILLPRDRLFDEQSYTFEQNEMYCNTARQTGVDGFF